MARPKQRLTDGRHRHLSVRPRPPPPNCPSSRTTTHHCSHARTRDKTDWFEFLPVIYRHTITSPAYHRHTTETSVRSVPMLCRCTLNGLSASPFGHCLCPAVRWVPCLFCTCTRVFRREEVCGDRRRWAAHAHTGTPHHTSSLLPPLVRRHVFLLVVPPLLRLSVCSVLNTELCGWGRGGEVMGPTKTLADSIFVHSSILSPWRNQLQCLWAERKTRP